MRPCAADSQEINAFNKLDVMRAIVLAGKADMEGIVPIFLFDLAQYHPAPPT